MTNDESERGPAGLAERLIAADRKTDPTGWTGTEKGIDPMFERLLEDERAFEARLRRIAIGSWALALGCLVLMAISVAFLGDDRGFLTGVTLQKMELGDADESGRRRPIPIPGSDFLLPIDVAVIAVGTGANPLVQSTTPDMQTNRRGYITADPETLRTTKRGVFAGGDIVSGSATVILAMGAGRSAARSLRPSG